MGKTWICIISTAFSQKLSQFQASLDEDLSRLAVLS